MTMRLEPDSGSVAMGTLKITPEIRRQIRAICLNAKSDAPRFPAKGRIEIGLRGHIDPARDLTANSLLWGYDHERIDVCDLGDIWNLTDIRNVDTLDGKCLLDCYCWDQVEVVGNVAVLIGQNGAALYQLPNTVFQNSVQSRANALERRLGLKETTR